MRTSLIEENTFKKFMESYSSYYHYLHDPLYYEYISSIQEVHLLGLYEDDELMGVSMLSAIPILKKYRQFTSHTGPLIKGFTNEKLKFFLMEVENYVKDQKALMIIHSPYHIYQIRDAEGEVTDSTVNNREIADVYKDLRYTHHGFTKQLVNEELLRHQAVLDIRGDETDILNHMNSTTRYNTRASERMNVQLRYLGQDEYDRFIKMYKETEARIGYDPVDVKRLKNLISILEERLFVTLSYVDLEAYMKRLETELADLESDKFDMQKKIDAGEGTKRMKNRLGEQKNLVTSKGDRLEKIRAMQAAHGNIIELSTAMYYYNNHEMVYLFSGSNPEFSMFMGTNYTTWQMIKKAKTLGLERFNFFGLTGDFTEASGDYGVYQFKKGYNPVIEELPGTFYKTFNRPVYKIAQKLNRIE
ncbi:peptidoglycan bridge formation glycyltransferase FemA/FemB family protein [Salinicoccus albus]|uniref:peptidoglycan bridge formation glycyltransferase FemA/FemB family protein n=1 Tax=Salinicoccus albus TaxID=418756 RepID=UPI000375AACA|nr:peptidoglycan bridge formation glycyltransferase FemA/FemB family protein [Salinicoccus albus]